MMTTRHSNTKRARWEGVKNALAVVLVLAAIIGWALQLRAEEQQRMAIWTESYPMANSHIEWTGAGYQGGI